MKLKISLLISLTLISNTTFSMFCPTNFNQINIGDTLEQVEAQCGKPTTSSSSKDETDEFTPQEWTFYTTMQQVDPFMSVGTVKITVAFVEGKVINISSGGYSVGETTACGGNNIQVGSTMKQVKTACGKPVMVDKGEPTPGLPPPVTDEIVEWTYQGTPTVILTFVNGKLESRK